MGNYCPTFSGDGPAHSEPSFGILDVGGKGIVVGGRKGGKGKKKKNGSEAEKEMEDDDGNKDSDADDRDSSADKKDVEDNDSDNFKDSNNLNMTANDSPDESNENDSDNDDESPDALLEKYPLALLKDEEDRDELDLFCIRTAKEGFRRLENRRRKQLETQTQALQMLESGEMQIEGDKTHSMLLGNGQDEEGDRMDVIEDDNGAGAGAKLGALENDSKSMKSDGGGKNGVQGKQDVDTNKSFNASNAGEGDIAGVSEGGSLAEGAGVNAGGKGKEKPKKAESLAKLGQEGKRERVSLNELKFVVRSITFLDSRNQAEHQVAY
jgi:hypothetical protein